MLRPLSFSIAVALFPLQLAAATFSDSLSYSTSEGFLPGGGFNTSANVNLGIATVDFGARASTGTVNASTSLTLAADFTDTVTLGDAGAKTSISLTASGVTSAFSTFVGATADVGIDFASALGINPPRISLGSVGYGIDTSGSGNGFGTINDTGNEAISGFGVPSFPGISLQAEVTLDGSQRSSLDVSALGGLIRATHTDGTFVDKSFSLEDVFSTDLDLSKAGEWSLELLGVGLVNSFDTDLGLAASARVGIAVGFDCGNFSTNSDNGFLCAFDEGAVATSPQLTLVNPAAFALDFGIKNLSLGAINVIAPAPVPLPAGMSLMLLGLGALGVARARRERAAA